MKVYVLGYLIAECLFSSVLAIFTAVDSLKNCLHLLTFIEPGKYKSKLTRILHLKRLPTSTFVFSIENLPVAQHSQLLLHLEERRWNTRWRILIKSLFISSEQTNFLNLYKTRKQFNLNFKFLCSFFLKSILALKGLKMYRISSQIGFTNEKKTQKIVLILENCTT